MNSLLGPVSVLQVLLHDVLLGHLVVARSGATALVFHPAWLANPRRPALTLSGTAPHPASNRLFVRPWLRSQGLHPLLANLLPESGMRPWITQQLAVNAADDTVLLAALGHDLPGALQIKALATEAIPPGVLDFNATTIALPPVASNVPAMFSLAGSQYKVQLHEAGGQFQTADVGHPGNWLVKLPSRLYTGLPQNEFTALTLAQLAGVTVPPFRLLSCSGLPAMPLVPAPQEEYALALQRFDRAANGARVHAEDFAQVLFKPPQAKYSVQAAEIHGQVVHGFTGAPLAGTQQLARRLLVNVLLGNGDAHLKNWSLLYPDRQHAQLAPAYDLVCTQTLLPEDRQQPLSIGGCNDWYRLEFSHFEQWSRAVGVPWQAIRPQLLDTVQRARTLWPGALEAAPMLETHKLLLRHHWKNLTKKLQYGL